MKINYDHNLKIAGIGIVPWGRLGPERWLQNYKIASLHGWDVTATDAPQLSALSVVDPTARLTRQASQQLIENPTFQGMIRTELQGYSMLTYKPVKPPSSLSDVAFISGNRDLSKRLENKVLFRRLCRDDAIPFPEYNIYERGNLQPGDATALLKGRQSVIVQDEKLSGGKGTFVVRGKESLAYALDSIAAMGGGSRVVVSEHVVNARERSVQCCATRYGVFVGPLQKQIIADPLLANLAVADADKFCGAEITPEDTLGAVYPEIKTHAVAIGEKIMAMGYRGIFSLDCLVDDTGKVYVLEVNARITGITPLLTMLYREGKDIPFYLLHILELAGADYSIEDAFVDPTGPEGSLLVIHSQAAEKVRLVSTPPSGLYDQQTVEFIKPAVGLTDGNQLLLQQYVPPSVVKSGGRLLTVLTNSRALNDNDELLPAVKRQLAKVVDKIAVQKI